MLSINAVSGAGATANYFAADNYYAKDSDEAREHSSWFGKGAELLGLSGVVEKEQFKEVLEGRLPNGEVLGRFKADGSIEHRPGWDLTFSAPKSVSILALVGGDERVEAAHHEAVAVALRAIEANAVLTRVGSGENIQEVATDNLIVAQFHHDSSRALDPALHTHNIVANATLRSDGRWRSIESQDIYRMKMLGGLIYRAELAQALQALGYQIEQTHPDGRFEVKGVSSELIKEFSQRRADIEQYMDERGMAGALDAAQAALMTRERKADVDRTELLPEWRERTERLGVDLAKVVEKADPRYVWLDDQSIVAREAVAFAAAKLAEREAAFKRDDLVSEALSHAMGSVTYGSVTRAVSEAVKQKSLIPARDAHEGALWTTPGAVKLEKDTIALMKAGRGEVASILTAREAEAALSERELKPGQLAAAKLILSSSDRVIGIQGYAGTGKTYMLDAVRELAAVQTIAAEGGYTVRGFAPTNAAAKQLESEAGIASSTVAEHLIQLKREGREDLSHEIWAVDESSMVSNRQMYDLLKGAEASGARVVLVGDVKQLGAVEAGKPFELLQKAGMSVAVMDDIQRQKNPELLGAVKDSIDGRVRDAFNRLGPEVVQIVDRQARLEAMAKDYLSVPSVDRDKALVFVPANEDRVAINQMIREGMKREGSLVGKELTTNVLVRNGITKVEAARASSYQVGNVVRFNRDYRGQEFNVSKEEYGRVTNVRKEAGIVELKMGDGRMVTWQPASVGASRVEVYHAAQREVQQGDVLRITRTDKSREMRNNEQLNVESVKDGQIHARTKDGQALVLDQNQMRDSHWEHSYASTGHAAQGRTVDRVIMHMENWRKNLANMRMLYVGLSRARHEARIYSNDKERLINDIQKRPGDKRSALEGVRGEKIEQNRQAERDRKNDTKAAKDKEGSPYRRILDGDGLLKEVRHERLKESEKQEHQNDARHLQEIDRQI